ncbi:MAG: hypothetical protein R2746_15145 [Acidimicrobiales bacterium]
MASSPASSGPASASSPERQRHSSLAGSNTVNTASSRAASATIADSAARATSSDRAVMRSARCVPITGWCTDATRTGSGGSLTG